MRAYSRLVLNDPNSALVMVGENEGGALFNDPEQLGQSSHLRKLGNGLTTVIGGLPWRLCPAGLFWGSHRYRQAVKDCHVRINEGAQGTLQGGSCWCVCECVCVCV